jgi:hypothetical protein
LGSGYEAVIPTDPTTVAISKLSRKYVKTQFSSGEDPFQHTFTTSACNKDKYTVTLSWTDQKGKKLAERTVTVEARRRVSYYYVEMKRPGGGAHSECPTQSNGPPSTLLASTASTSFANPPRRPLSNCPMRGGTPG